MYSPLIRNVWRGPAIALALILALWFAVSDILGVPKYLLPSPVAVAREIFTDARALGQHTLVTASESILGFALANIAAFLLAVGFFFFRTLRTAGYPLAVGLKSTPIVALAPLLTVWLGYGFGSKVTMATIIAFFPLLVNTSLGLTRVDPLAVDFMRTLGASPIQTFVLLRLPNALPDMVAGMKVSAPLAVMGAIVAEMTGGETGLGFAIVIATMRLDTDRAFAALFFASMLGIVAFSAVLWLEHVSIPVYQRSELQGDKR